MIAGARRRAVRGGDGQLDTAHLLHSLLESDPAVRAVFGDGARVARLLGLLVQRSIGYGLRWQGTVEDSGAVPVVRDGVARVVRQGGDPVVGDGADPVARQGADAVVRDKGPRDAAGWSPAALHVMELAQSRARAGGRGAADGTDVLAALASDEDCRGVEILRRAGVDANELLERIDAGFGGPLMG